MDYLKHRDVSISFSFFGRILAKLSLFLYFFFVFFGTSIPFQKETSNIGDFATSNTANQIIFSSLFIISAIIIISKRHEILQFVKVEKFLSIFLLWSFLSVFWSDFTIISFKRWFQIFGMVIIFLAALFHFQSTKEVLKIFKAVLAIYLPLCLLSVLLIPEATQWEFPAWRGLAPQKNTLGQISLISIMILSFAPWEGGRVQRTLHIILLIISFILLIGSKSTTSILTGLIVLFLNILSYAEKIIVRPVVGGMLSMVLFLTLLLSIISIIYIEPSIVAMIFDVFGKDLTFTNRVDIWISIFEEAKKHLLLGCGFGGFWGVNSLTIDLLYREFIWFPTHAHSGYLDMINETGIIGISFFALMVISYFINLIKFQNSNYWKWFFVVCLILNITETTIFRPQELSGAIFIFSYVVFYVDVIKNKIENSH
jgi:O-antigen ligase